LFIISIKDNDNRSNDETNDECQTKIQQRIV